MTNLQFVPEIWAQSPEINYEVSSYGNIRSKKRRVNLKPNIGTHGYYYVQCGSKNSKTLHRLIAIAFIPNPKNLEQVNHKDGNKLNNNIDNLEWVTRADNARHSFRLGLSYQTKAIKLNVYKDNILIGCYNSMLEAATKLSVQRADIWRFLKGERKNPIRGYTFSKA